MNCEDLRDSYELYALGVLDAEEKQEIEAHLARNCENCQRYLHEALAVNALLLSQTREMVPPSRLKRRVMASVGAERSGFAWGAALAAAFALIIAMWLSLGKRTADRELADARRTLQQSVTERDRLEQAVSFLNQPETRQVNFGLDKPAPPRGNFFLNPRLGVLLIASNLPALPAGKAYEMWVIPKGGAPRPAGLFQSGVQGTATHIASGPVDSSVTVAVTVEPETGSPGPTSAILFSAGF
ncbi:MAG TPA: anti-sigma factor [Bryobacteraceae bacterium]|jgi:anti-sigma-K factor RskA